MTILSKEALRFSLYGYSLLQVSVLNWKGRTILLITTILKDASPVNNEILNVTGCKYSSFYFKGLFLILIFIINLPVQYH